MKIALLLLAFTVVALLAGCATTAVSGKSDAQLVQRVLDEILPASFSGDLDAEHANQFFDIAIRAGNVRKDAAGKWTYDWLVYTRKSHFPAWSSSGKITIGTPPRQT